jgi:hypothetical protein
MENLTEQLQQIEKLLEKAINSPECLELLESAYYNPDVTLADSLLGIRQAIYSHQVKLEIQRKSEDFDNAPWLTGGSSRSTDGSTYGDFLSYDAECAALATKNAETLTQKDFGEQQTAVKSYQTLATTHSITQL